MTRATCACGRVEFELSGAPIVSAICHCDDCQAGSRRIEALPGAAPLLDPYGGTAYVHHRKDRVRCTKGADLLAAQKLKPASPTNRVVATCCNSAMLVNFDIGLHWLPIYRARIPDPPPSEMRIQTKFASTPLPNDILAYRGLPLRLVMRLLGARIAMLFGR